LGSLSSSMGSITSPTPEQATGPNKIVEVRKPCGN
jgi:hypothetical protein